MIPSALQRCRFLLVTLAAATALAGCAEEEDDVQIEGPDFPTGPGRIYAVNDVTFNSVDGVPVAALYGRAPGTIRLPTVILVHDLGDNLAGQRWLQAGFFEELLDHGYNVLAIDLRGHGGTPLPDDGRATPQLLYSDLEVFHLDVRAGITWLRSQPSVETARLAVVGDGVGGNVAFVSMGAFPEDLQAAVALSPGLWDLREAAAPPLVIGAGLSPFTPHSILYLVGDADLFAISQTQALSYAGFATALASATGDPKTLQVLSGVSLHGIALLSSPATVQIILNWLASNL